MAERLAATPEQKPGTLRKVGGTGLEVAGVIVGAEGLLAASLYGIVLGMIVWTGGAWLKNYGTDSRNNQTGAVAH